MASTSTVNSKPLWIGIAVVLLVVGVSAGAYFLYQQHQKQVRHEQAEKFIEKQKELQQKSGKPSLLPLGTQKVQ